MLKTKLTALEHPTPDAVDVNDRKVFANTILWLEDQKIRHYKIDDRAGLRKIDKPNEWEKAYNKYKMDVGVPKVKTAAEEITWLTGYAVRLEYLDAADKFKDVNSEFVQKNSGKSNEPSVKTENAFDNINFNDEDFIDGVRILAKKLGIAHHPNHLVQLEAVKRVVHERLSPSAAETPIIEGAPFPFEKGNDVVCDEPQLNKAVRILRLLQIQSLRELQTNINETIVTVQELTANPKTDSKLGKVGF